MILIRPDIIRLICVVCFIQGSLGIAGIALPLFLRASNFSIKEIAYYTSIVAIPWFFKIVYGAISDALPIFGQRRKPYIVLCGIIASMGWLLMSASPPKMFLLVIAMMIANLGYAATDVVLDGIVVERSTARTSQIYQSYSWGARCGGALFSGAIGGYLAAALDYQIIFGITAVLPLISALAVCFYRERRTRRQALNLFVPIMQSFKNILSGDLRWFCLLLIVMSFSSAFITPLFFYMKEELGFQEKFLGWLSSITWLGAITGCLLYLNFLRKMRLKSALYMAIGIGFFEILFCLLIQNRETALVVCFIGGGMGCLSLLPLTSASAKLAHGTGVESSLFSILMGIFNLGQSASTFWGGWLFERIGIRLLILLTAFLILSGIWLIKQIKAL